MKVEIDAFSGYKIYPSKGRLFVRGDSKVFRFSRSKTESLFHQRKNPRKISWTQVYRRMHKKGITEETAKRRRRAVVKHQRGIVGVSMDRIRQLRDMTAKQREAEREKIKLREKGKKKSKADKPQPTTTAPKASKMQQTKGGKGGRGGR